ncbi:unnamed protein product [Eruca vesicaria subsp. sativa]|uniref:DUF1216 domain-containing protein n=1 Tax=Eruca vesicaria subsp. sativa TaxID=29727 RepID=A0ABC8KVC1_ERUVS|nr:unnamed protein product [Eruca vesicaria subsp. sativa]
MSFISGLEKKYSQKAELKPFFEKLKASMTVSSKVASTKSAQDYSSTAKSTTDEEQTTQEKLMTSPNQFKDLNSKIVGEKKVSSTQETEIKQKISKIEQGSLSSLRSRAWSMASSEKQNAASSQQQNVDSSQQQNSMGKLKTN